jgi:hypothetical protein
LESDIVLSLVPLVVLHERLQRERRALEGRIAQISQRLAEIAAERDQALARLGDRKPPVRPHGRQRTSDTPCQEPFRLRY